MAAVVPVSEIGRFGPMPADHPSIGNPCVACGEPIREGDRPALVNGVPADAEEQAKADEGRAHNLECGIAHEACAFPAGGGS